MLSAYRPTPVPPGPLGVAGADPAGGPAAVVPEPRTVAVPAQRTAAVPAQRAPGVPGRYPVPVVAPWPGASGTAGPPPAGVPPHLAAVLDAPPRPGTATAAGVLWIVLGVLELFWAAAVFGLGTGLPALVPLLMTATGLATVALSAAMLSGYQGARTAVVVLGGLSLVAVLPVLLWVPAVILQLHPASVAWSADAARRRRACRDW